MSITVLSIEDDGVAALGCAGELNGLQMDGSDLAAGDEAADLAKHLGDDWATKRVAMDMGEASYMDSAAIGWLLSLHKSFKAGGGMLVVCNVQPAIKRVIELMRIDQVVPMTDTLDQAMHKLREDA